MISRRAAIFGIAMTILITIPAVAQTSTITFRVIRGDTYMNLFGPDWEKAYRQNRMTAVRAGHTLTSPDLLVENSIVTVSPEVRLTPRAWNRLQELQQRRTALKSRLDTLTPKLREDPGLQRTAAECRSLLDSGPRLAYDIPVAEEEIAHLERLVGNQPGVDLRILSGSRWPVVLSPIAGLALTLVLLWRRHRRVRPEGAARYREALKDVQAAFQRAGVRL
jgi:hypothetical protein